MRIADGGGDTNFAAINLEGMQALIKDVTKAGSTLQSHASSWQTRANGLGVSTPAFGKISAIGSWAEGEVPGLRRRLALAEAMETKSGTTMSVVEIDETKLDTLTPAQAKAQAAKDAKELKGELDDNGAAGSGLSEKMVAELESKMNDPYYAAAFAKSYSPQELAGVLNRLNIQQQGAKNYHDPDLDPRDANQIVTRRQQRLLGALSNTISLATRGTGDLAMPANYAQQFLDAIGAGDATSIPLGAPASINALMSHGDWGTKFSTEFNNGLIAFENTDRFQQINGASNVPWFKRLSEIDSGIVAHTPDGKLADWDPMVGGMSLLGKDPQAAQAVLKNPDVIKFLADRDWPTDKANAFGNAIDAATTVLRGNNATGRMSAKIASVVVNTLDPDKLTGDMSNMRDSMGRLLAGYIIDIKRVANGGSDGDVPGVYVPPLHHANDPDIPGVEPPGANFDVDKLKAIMGATETDHDAFKTVIAASTALSRTLVDTACKQAAKHKGVNGRLARGILPVEISNAMGNAAKLQGMVMATGDAGNIDKAKIDDANRATALDFIRGVVDLAPIPGGELVNWAAAQGKDALFNRFNTDETSAAVNNANDADAANLSMMEQLVVGSMNDAGMLEGTKLSPYAYEPKGSAADFTDKDGHILPLEELAKDKVKLRAYKAWLHGNKSPLGPVRGPIDSVVNSAYPHWGS